MFVIILNQNNIVQNGQNNTLIYRFPNSVNLTDKYISVSSVIMYYSWFNISSLYFNNKITYTWTAGVTKTTYTIEIPDGLYEINDINEFIQFKLIQNGHYLINDAGLNVYFLELRVNANRYAIQLNTYLFPIALPVGWSVPSNWSGVFPTQSFNPEVVFQPTFNEIVGYSPTFISNNNVNDAYVPPTPSSKTNNYVAKDGFGTLSYLSDLYPNVQPNSSVFLSLSNVSNPYSIPSSIIYSIAPSVGIGEQIVDRPPNFMWTKMINGTYNELTLQFLGTNSAPLILQDPEMSITLVIRDKNDMF
jgi:hypothetical protein